MKVLLYGKGNKRGIYKIINLKSGRIYFGSTKRLRKRAYEHKRDLRKSKHQNTILQADFNKHGENNFIFEVVETVDGGRNELLKKEQCYLNKFYDKQKHCYNLCLKAGSREGSKNSRPYDPTTDGRAKPKTDEWIQEVSAKNKELWNKPERKKEASKHAHKRWNKHSSGIIVTNKHTGETVVIEGSIRNFCKNRKISYRAFHLMVKEKTKSSAGWFLGTKRPKYIERKGEKRSPMSKEQKLLRSSHQWEGTVIQNYITKESIVLGKNIKDDCSEDLNYHALRRLLQGKINITKNGWYIKGQPQILDNVVNVCPKCILVFSSKSGFKAHVAKHNINKSLVA